MPEVNMAGPRQDPAPDPVPDPSPALAPDAGPAQARTATDASPSDGDGADALPHITPLQRVERIATAVVPIHRELAPREPPAKPQRVGVGLTFAPFTPVSRPRQMRTMSDLVDMAQPVRPSAVARLPGRHVPAPPTDEKPGS